MFSYCFDFLLIELINCIKLNNIVVKKTRVNKIYNKKKKYQTTNRHLY